MSRFDTELRVFLHREPIDFRTGINSLVMAGRTIDATRCNSIHLPAPCTPSIIAGITA